MKERKLIEVKITPEEMKILSSNRRKRKKRYLRHLKRVRRMQRIKRKFLKHAYPLKQRVYGVLAIVFAILLYSISPYDKDGEIAFSALMLALLGMFMLFSRDNIIEEE